MSSVLKSAKFVPQQKQVQVQVVEQKPVQVQSQTQSQVSEPEQVVQNPEPEITEKLYKSFLNNIDCDESLIPIELKQKVLSDFIGILSIFTNVDIPKKCNGVKKDGSPCNISGSFVKDGYCSAHKLQNKNPSIETEKKPVNKTKTEKLKCCYKKPTANPDGSFFCHNPIGVKEHTISEESYILCSSHFGKLMSIVGEGKSIKDLVLDTSTQTETQKLTGSKGHKLNDQSPTKQQTESATGQSQSQSPTKQSLSDELGF
jgi:hypothetical protein